SQYWTEEFGNRARLLGGAVIGDPADMSACFYNPGGLALVTDPEILLAGNVLRYETIRVETVGGRGISSTSSRFGSVPSLFGGELGHEPGKRNRLAYSFLTRQAFERRSSVRLELTDADLGLPAGLTFLGGDSRIDQRLTEHWAGMTWSRKMNQKYAVGVSPYIAVRSHRSRAQELIEGLADTTAVAFDRANDFEYLHWRLLAKFGIAADLGDWKLGAILTTPSVSLWGSGEVSYDRILVSQIPGNNGPIQPDVTSNTQEDLKAKFHSPLSLGAGVARKLGNTNVHVSAEWFNGVEATEILDPDDFAARPSGELVDLNVIYEMKALTNVGIGVDHVFNPGLTAYGSFRSDLSGNVPNSNSTTATWDIYHLAGGAIIQRGKAGVTLGGVFSFGDSGTYRRIDLTQTPLRIGELPNLTVHYLRAMGVIGFNFAF
ncbi:MAG TPA: hypothetical protein VNM87_09050, partial [Candidatus Udaeobacter sp.]|nr:hypothetical protein [Candidatus Udaeobacter sp.]